MSRDSENNADFFDGLLHRNADPVVGLHLELALAIGADYQYTSEYFQELLREQGIICGMSRAGEV